VAVLEELVSEQQARISRLEARLAAAEVQEQATAAATALLSNPGLRAAAASSAAASSSCPADSAAAAAPSPLKQSPGLGDRFQWGGRPSTSEPRALQLYQLLDNMELEDSQAIAEEATALYEEHAGLLQDPSPLR